MIASLLWCARIPCSRRSAVGQGSFIEYCHWFVRGVWVERSNVNRCTWARLDPDLVWWLLQGGSDSCWKRRLTLHVVWTMSPARKKNFYVETVWRTKFAGVKIWSHPWHRWIIVVRIKNLLPTFELFFFAFKLRNPRDTWFISWKRRRPLRCPNLLFMFRIVWGRPIPAGAKAVQGCLRGERALAPGNVVRLERMFEVQVTTYEHHAVEAWVYSTDDVSGFLAEPRLELLEAVSAVVVSRLHQRELVHFLFRVDRWWFDHWFEHEWEMLRVALTSTLHFRENCSTHSTPRKVINILLPP